MAYSVSAAQPVLITSITPPDLARNGANIWTSQVSAMNSSELRGEQRLQQVQTIIAYTGKDKVNLIGHSHGGQSVR